MVALTDQSHPNSDGVPFPPPPPSACINVPPAEGLDASRPPPTGASLRWAALLATTRGHIVFVSAAYLEPRSVRRRMRR
jgi:hypothetical protein